MYSIAARSAAKRATGAAVGTHASRTAAVTQVRFTSTVHENDPEVLDREKSRNLGKKQFITSSPIDNAPGWNEYLASASEANVKADRSDLSPSELAARTVEYVTKRQHEEEEDLKSSGDSHEERIDAREASYERDEIRGPLGGRGVSETEVVKETTKKKSTA